MNSMKSVCILRMSKGSCDEKGNYEERNTKEHVPDFRK